MRWDMSITVAEPRLVGELGAYLGVRLRVHGGEGVVEHHDRGALHQHPRYRHALLLPAGERHAALADHGAVALGELADGLVHAGDARGAADLRLAGARLRGGDVLRYRAGEEEGLLQHEPDVPAQVGAVNVAYVHAADAYLPLSLAEVVEPVKQVDEGALPAAGASEDGEGGAGGDGEAHVVQHLAALVAEGDVLEFDVARHGRG